MLNKAPATLSVSPFIGAIPSGTDASAHKNINSHHKKKGHLNYSNYDINYRIIIAARNNFFIVYHL